MSSFSEFMQQFAKNEEEAKEKSSFINKDEEKKVKIKLKRKVESKQECDDLPGKKEIKKEDEITHENAIKPVEIEEKEGKKEAEDIKEIERVRQETEDEQKNLEKILTLFKNSETNEEWKGKWMEIYEKALKSTKKTLTNDKIRRGRFRINEKGDIEILPDFPTHAFSAKGLLQQKWL